MILLILGLALWWATHLFPILGREPRARAVGKLGLGPYKGFFALIVLGAVALMTVGYQRAPFIPLWMPPMWLWHVNNLLMLLAVFVFIAGSFPSVVRRRIRHPQLTGVKIWALAHLLVNGDVDSIVLFGGLLAWAVVALIFTNRRDGPRGELPEATGAGLAAHIGATLVVFAVVGWVHGWAGVWPFPG